VEQYEYRNGPPAPRMVAELAMRHDALREQNRVLRGWLGKALDRAREHNEGCLYCGEGEIIDGETTPEHRAECWWYRAQAALTATSQEPTA